MIKIAQIVRGFHLLKLFLSRFICQARAYVRQFKSDYITFRKFLREEGLVMPREILWAVVKEMVRLILITPLFFIWIALFIPLLAEYLDLYSIEEVSQKIFSGVIILLFWLIQIKIFMLSRYLSLFILLFFLTVLLYNYSYAPPYRYNLLDYLQSWLDFILFLEHLIYKLLEWLDLKNPGYHDRIAMLKFQKLRGVTLLTM